MNTQQHFEELLELLEKNSVEYLIVGGYAVAFFKKHFGGVAINRAVSISYNNTFSAPADKAASGLRYKKQ